MASAGRLLTEFHPYPRLPVELKAMIWRHALNELSPSAHNFNLEPENKDRSKLAIKPSQSYWGRDPSAWTHIPYILRGCDIAHLFTRDLSPKGMKIYQKKNYKFEKDAQADGTTKEVVIDEKKDLVKFNLRYGQSLASVVVLTNHEPQPALNGITRIGVDLPQVQTSLDKRSRPFWCDHQTPLTAHSSTNHICPSAVIRFFRLCKDLRTFYIILTPTKNLYAIPYFTGRVRRFWKVQGNKTGVPQMRLDVFSVFQENAEKKGLEQFHDRKGSYCEITSELTRSYFNVEMEGVWRAKGKIERSWARLRRVHGGQGLPAIRIKVLCFCDLRNAQGPKGERIR
ncbi:hypothetical protein F5Y16DRAFT_174108 [Xylariaceae sp. FL0255]|nr:hypothetical protein F5Y16DRAFT_174108 [Xylariaceae sp. FL0255]